MISAVKIAVIIGEIRKKDVDVFETCFVYSIKIRKTCEYKGLAFLNPNSNIISINKVTYSRSKTIYNNRNYNLIIVKEHPNFDN